MATGDSQSKVTFYSPFLPFPHFPCSLFPSSPFPLFLIQEFIEPTVAFSMRHEFREEFCMRNIRAGIVMYFIEFVLNTCQVRRLPPPLLPLASSLSPFFTSLPSSPPSLPHLPPFLISLPSSPLSVPHLPPSLPPSPPSLPHLPPFFISPSFLTSLTPSLTSPPSLPHLLPFLTFLPRDSWRLQESTAPPTLPHSSSFSQDWYMIWRDPPLATW